VPNANQPAAGGRRRPDLRADCEHCFALCCVATAFSASADFAITKPAGQPCPNLRAGFRCSIHDRLRNQGFAGCAAYDCFGAGQHVAQVTYGGRDWRRSPQLAGQMFAVFRIMRQLHELLWHLNEALALRPASPLHDDLSRALAETERLRNLGADVLAELDLSAHRRDVTTLLRRASQLARVGIRAQPAGRPGTGIRTAGADLAGADLIGKDLRGADLRGVSLRASRLAGADLRGADLRTADLTGADLRGARLAGADLTGSIFLTQSQLDAATGDRDTRLPPPLIAPAHWCEGSAAGS
jgi:uncharacterized protein YjbI with pentapeptide repeats